MCKWKIRRCECPVSYCTEGLEKFGSLEVEYYFNVPYKYAAPILETVCRAVANGFEIEDGVMVRDLFKNVSVFFFKTKSLSSDKDVFRLILPDWEGEYPWEIYSGISQKAHFKRQIKFETDKVFCLVVSVDEIKDKETLSDFSEYEGMHILPFLYYVSEYDSCYCVAPWFDKFHIFELYKGKRTELEGISNERIVCMDLDNSHPAYKDFQEWKSEYERGQV